MSLTIVLTTAQLNALSRTYTYNTEYHQNHKQFRIELTFPAEPICSPTYLLDFTLPFTLIFVQKTTELQILKDQT